MGRAEAVQFGQGRDGLVEDDDVQVVVGAVGRPAVVDPRAAEDQADDAGVGGRL
ncbi:hypothetical protein ACFU3E_08860 [Streptomyces sp. NPDC057424]|uniref:hypothetical protein n=1 Tax=Streptomyces sp. NPDC057424 TaxID=3346127 RepID=UPI0036B7DC6E